MLHMQCPHCGDKLEIEDQYAGQHGRCNHCGQPITVPTPWETPPPLTGAKKPQASTPPPMTAEQPTTPVPPPVPPSTTGPPSLQPPALPRAEGERAPEQLQDAVPPEVLEMHARRRTQRRIRVAAITTVCLLGVSVFGMIVGGDDTPDTPQEAPPVSSTQTPEATAPASNQPKSRQVTAIPPSANPPVRQPQEAQGLRTTHAPNERTMSPPSPETEPDIPGLVYVVGGGSRYHEKTCQHYERGTGERASLTPEEATAWGYTPCRVCNPGGYGEVRHSQPQYTAPTYQPPGQHPTQEVTVYVTNAGEKYHRAGCSSLRQSQRATPLSQARARYTPCSRCNPPR